MGRIEDRLDWYAARRGVTYSREALEGSAKPPSVKRWRCWILAEACRRQGDLTAATVWIGTADGLDQEAAKDLVWIAERATTCGKAFVAAAEPALAFNAFDVAYTTWREIGRQVGGSASHLTGARQSFNPVIRSALQFVEVLLGLDPIENESDRSQALAEWVGDRLFLELHASAVGLIEAADPGGSVIRATEVALNHLAWLATTLDREGPPLLSTAVRNSMGTLEYGQANLEAALAHYNAALYALRPWRGIPDVDAWTARLRLNSANVLSGQGSFAEATEIYDEVIEQSAKQQDPEAELLARLARLDARRRQGAAEDEVLRTLRELIARCRAFVEEDRGERAAAKRAAEGMYRLLLTVLARRPRPDQATLDEMAGLVSALRNEYLLPGAQDQGDQASRLIESPLGLLDRRLRRLPDTLLLVWELGIDCVVLLAIRGGPGPITERAVAAACGEDLSQAADALLAAARAASDALIAREVTAGQLDPAPVEEAGRGLWAAIPAPIRELLANAGTLLFSPSAVGATEELPVELVLTEDGFYGLTHIVARAPSLLQLMAALAPNRANRVPPARSAVIRAQDPPDLDVLASADQDAARVHRALGALGLAPVRLDAPSQDQTMELLDSDLRLVHYVGHGMATESGEALFLSMEEHLLPGRLGLIRGSRTPLCYLSACFVGRMRHGRGGALRGFGSALLGAGAPGVIAATYAVPDHLCGELSKRFYANAWRHPVGEALRRARVQLADQGMHPIAWASFVLQGDPQVVLTGQAGGRSSARFTLDWPAMLTRFLATGNAAYRDTCMKLLQTAAGQDPDHAEVFDWVKGQIRAEEAAVPVEDNPQVRQALSRLDPEGEAALRLLGAARRVAAMVGQQIFPRRSLSQEIGGALSLALALDDTYAYLLFTSAAAEYLTARMAPLGYVEARLDALAADAVQLDHLLQHRRALEVEVSESVNVGTLLGSDLYARAETGDPEALAEAAAVMGRLIPGMQLDPQTLAEILTKVLAAQVQGRFEDPPDPELTAPTAASAHHATSDDGELAEMEAELRWYDQAGSGPAASDLGRLLDQRGDITGALAAYRRADERGNAIGSFNLGDLCYRLRKYNEAERAYGRADQRGHARGAYNLGVLRQGRGEDRAAEEAYWRAVQRGWVLAAFNLSGLLAERADGERELREADRQGRPGASFVLGRLLERRGDLEGAAEAFGRAVQQGYPAGPEARGI